MDISIKICCQVASWLIPLNAANKHDGLAGFLTKYPVDVKFMVRVGEKYLMDYLGPGTGMKNNSDQQEDEKMC